MSTESKALGKGRNAGWVKWLAVTLVLGVGAFLASPNAPLGGFWGPIEGPTPTGAQTFLLIILGAIQSLVFGLGVAFLIFGFPLVNATPLANRGLALATYLAIAWSLISWWPHISLHQTSAARSISSLLAVEYGFHATLIIGGLIVAYYFVTKM